MKYLNLDGLVYLVSLIKSKIDAGGSIGAQNAAAIAAVEAKIPAQASAENQLADKSFVNSSVATNTANFIGTFDSVDALNAYGGAKTNNDYAFVRSTDAAGNTLFKRYKWNGTAWLYEYELNNSSFTAAQWAAVNSGITAAMLPSGAGSADPLAKKSQVTAVSDIVSAIVAKIPSAASATNQLADKSWVSALTAGAVLSASNKISATNPPRIAAGQVQVHTVYGGDAGGPATYGNLINIGGSGGGQLFLEWTGGQTAAGQSVPQGIWYRSMRDTQSGWTAWTKVAMLGQDGSLTLAGGLDVANTALFRKQVFFEHADKMVVGHGKPPKDFVDMGNSAYTELVEGAYMAHGDDETGGIIVGGDGIDEWAPPDNELHRFWNEDEGDVVAAVSGDGTLKGIASTARLKEVKAFFSWSSFNNYIKSLIGQLSSNKDVIVPGISGRIGSDGYYGVDVCCFVRGSTGGPTSSEDDWFVDTKLVTLSDGDSTWGVQVAWAVTSSTGRTSYKRSYMDEWYEWSGNDL